MIENERTGFLVDNVEQAVAAIKRIPTIDRRNCRRRVEENFSIDSMVDAYERVYATIFELEQRKR